MRPGAGLRPVDRRQERRQCRGRRYGWRLLAGADVTMNNFTFGLAGGYASADSDVDDRASSVNADTVLIAAYAGASFDAFKLRGGASYAGASSTATAPWWWAISSRSRPRPMTAPPPARSPKPPMRSRRPASRSSRSRKSPGAGSRPTASPRRTRRSPGLTSGGLDFDTTYTTLGARVATTFEMSARWSPCTPAGLGAAFDGVTSEMAMAPSPPARCSTWPAR